MRKSRKSEKNRINFANILGVIENYPIFSCLVIQKRGKKVEMALPF